MTQDSNMFMQTRRDFCATACKGATVVAAMSALGALMEGCGAAGPTDGASSTTALSQLAGTASGNGTVTLTVDAASPLATVGGMALVTSSRASFLVARTGEASFLALTAICTHQGCLITRHANQDYVCPCHGSQYTASGQVLRGPASSPLHPFQTQFANGVLTIAG